MIRILDPRSKLVLLILAAVYISLQFSITVELLIIIIYISPFFLAKLYKYGFTFLGIYLIQLFSSSYLLLNVNNAFLLFILSYLVHGLRILFPSIIMGTYAIKTTTVSEWIAAFKKIHMPNWLLIPLAVMARFFPTVYEDYQHIRNAMAFRGIGTNLGDLVKHPVQTLEFILIPLLMNATQVADDLTVSSLTKGLSLPGEHTSIIPLTLTIYDWTYIIIAFLPLILYLGGLF